MVVTLMTAGGCVTGAAVFGLIFIWCRSSLKHEKRKIDAMAEEMRAEVPARYLRG